MTRLARRTSLYSAALISVALLCCVLLAARPAASASPPPRSAASAAPQWRNGDVVLQTSASAQFPAVDGADLQIATEFQSGGLLPFAAVAVSGGATEALLAGVSLSEAASIDVSNLSLDSGPCWGAPGDTIIVLTSDGHYFAVGDFSLSIAGLAFDYFQFS